MRRVDSVRWGFRLLLLPLLTGVVACGGADFAGGDGGATRDSGGTTDAEDDGPKTPSSEDDTLATPQGFASLTWFWQCDAAPVDAPTPKTGDDVVVEGVGPHEFDKDQLRGTPITVSGRICEPEQLPRDIVFVIDVSGSMEGNDPIDATGSCGRLAALNATIAAIPKGSARFGLVTFSSGMDVASSALFDTADELAGDVAPGGSLAGVVCAVKEDTNYDAGFAGAKALLSGGREDATKEIYFISDGKPEPSFQNGVQQAVEMRNVGVSVGSEQINVTIAAIMLAGKDEVMEQFLVSSDSSGKKLYAHAADAASLTKTLTELAANEIVGGDVKYRAIGTAPYTTLTLLDHLQGFNFTLPSFNIDIDQAPLGLEVLFEYFDRHDNRYSTGGKILWVAQADGGT